MTKFIVVSNGKKGRRIPKRQGVLLKEQSPEEVSFKNGNLYIHGDSNYWPGVLLDKIKLTWGLTK